MKSKARTRVDKYKDGFLSQRMPQISTQLRPPVIKNDPMPPLVADLINAIRGLTLNPEFNLPPATINVPKANVTVNVPEQVKPSVIVNVPQQEKQPAPVINVRVPQQPKPEVIVNVPEIKFPEIAFPESNPATGWDFVIIRDNRGLISNIKANRIDGV